MTTMTEPSTTTQVYQLYIGAPAEEVWEAITDPATVARFFFGQVREATYEVGGRLRSWSPDRSQMWGDANCPPRVSVVVTHTPGKRFSDVWR